jgi:hypothetical protein
MFAGTPMEAPLNDLPEAQVTDVCAFALLANKQNQ